MSLASAPTSASPGTADPGLDAIRAKVEAGERLSLADGDLLYTTPDVWTVCELADLVRRRLHGDVAYYNVNRHFNYCNVCALSCRFCDFYAKAGDAKAYTRTLDDARAEARKAVEAGATEIHMVGGLHPTLPWDYYPDLVRAIKETARDLGSDLHVKAFTAVEIVHLARIARVYRGASDPTEAGRAARMEAIRWVLTRLMDAGLGSLPGGGAEIFDDRVHDEAFKGKIRSDVWLDVHRVAHQLGLNTNATILYGHIEDRRDRLVHMDMLRRAQDEALARSGVEVSGSGVKVSRCQGVEGAEESDAGSSPQHLDTSTPRHLSSGRFQCLIPLPFIPDGSALERLPGPSGLENLRTLAIGRLMVDNIPHVKAFWIMQTLGMAQLMLQCGADDIDGTVVWYDITKVPQGQAEVPTHQEVTVPTLRKAIREAGFRPVERDTLYRRVERAGRAWSAHPA